MQKMDVFRSTSYSGFFLLVFWFITMSKCCYQSEKKHKNCTFTLCKNKRFQRSKTFGKVLAHTD